MRSMGSHRSIASSCGHRNSDYAAQTDLSLHLVHIVLYRFCRVTAHLLGNRHFPVRIRDERDSKCVTGESASWP